MTSNDELMTALAEIDALSDDLEQAYACYGDLYAEYRGEIARYGDAWPGAALQVRDYADSLATQSAHLSDLVSYLDARWPVQGPTHTPDPETDPWFPFGEEPF